MDWVGVLSLSPPELIERQNVYVCIPACFFAAITRSSDHKRRATGGRRHPHHKKRKYASGRAPAATKLGQKRIHLVRGRGGNTKFRALRLEEGNFSWGSEGTLVSAGDYQSKQHMQHVLMRRAVFTVSLQVLDTILPCLCAVVTRKTRIVGVVYNASNNELVRTNTLVKNSVIEIDATPFKEWYEKHYRVAVPKKGEDAKEATEVAAVDEAGAPIKQSNSLQCKIAARRKDRIVDPKILTQMQSGRVLAVISSRPGQSGRADGYLLEGTELEFYQRKLAIKKGKGAQ